MTTEQIAAALQALVDDAKARGINDPAARHTQRSHHGELATHSFTVEWGGRRNKSEVGFGATPAEALDHLRERMTKVIDPNAEELADMRVRAIALGYSLTDTA